MKLALTIMLIIFVTTFAIDHNVIAQADDYIDLHYSLKNTGKSRIRNAKVSFHILENDMYIRGGSFSLRSNQRKHGHISAPLDLEPGSYLTRVIISDNKGNHKKRHIYLDVW